MQPDAMELLLSELRGSVQEFLPQIERGVVTRLDIEVINYGDHWEVNPRATINRKILKSWTRKGALTTR